MQHMNPKSTMKNYIKNQLKIWNISQNIKYKENITKKMDFLNSELKYKYVINYIFLYCNISISYELIIHTVKYIDFLCTNIL